MIILKRIHTPSIVSNIATNTSGIADNSLAIDVLETTISGVDTKATDNYQYIINIDTAHDNLAVNVLTEATSIVSGSSIGTVLDTVTQSGTLGAKWFAIAYDELGNRYACDIYAIHDGDSTAVLTEYAILNIGTTMDIDFDVTADSSNMNLIVDNGDSTSVTIKTQRVTINTTSVDTTAVIS